MKGRSRRSGREAQSSRPLAGRRKHRSLPGFQSHRAQDNRRLSSRSKRRCPRCSSEILTCVPANLRTPTWVRCGAISLRVCSHFPPIEGSKFASPVMLPPGRARFATMPTPSGSEIPTKTTGIEFVASRTAFRTDVPKATMIAGAEVTSSATTARILEGSVHRSTMWILRPSTKPNSEQAEFKHAPCSLPARSDKPDKDDRGIASFLLSARCKWPRGGASDQANELASPHLTHRERVVLNFWTITFSIGPVRGLRRNNVLHCKSVQGHRRPQPRWPKARLASPSEPSYTVPLFGFADRGARAASPGRAKVVNDTGC